jgi:hypothetical protein
MREKIEKYQVIVYLVLIILIMVSVKIKYGGENAVVEQNVIVTPTSIPTPVLINKYPLQDELPHKGKGYVIDKYNSPMTLNLILDGATQKEAANDISAWLSSLGEKGSGHIIEFEEASPTAKLKR